MPAEMKTIIQCKSWRKKSREHPKIWAKTQKDIKWEKKIIKHGRSTWELHCMYLPEVSGEWEQKKLNRNKSVGAFERWQKPSDWKGGVVRPDGLHLGDIQTSKKTRRF